MKVPQTQDSGCGRRAQSRADGDASAEDGPARGPVVPAGSRAVGDASDRGRGRAPASDAGPCTRLCNSHDSYG
jgi:hypothetical protein